jgi:hypothetical protein
MRMYLSQTLFGWLAVSHPAVLFSHIILAPVISQLAVFFSHNKSAPATSHRPAERDLNPNILKWTGVKLN